MKTTHQKMKTSYGKIFFIFTALILASMQVSATIDLALENLQATKTVAANGPIQLAFTIKNTGDEPATIRLSLQPYTQENYAGLGTHDLFMLDKITAVTVYAADGTTRIEQVQEKKVLGKEIDENGNVQEFTQAIDTITILPTEYIATEYDFQFRDSNINKIGEHTIGLRFVGYEMHTAASTTPFLDRTGKIVNVTRPATIYLLGQKQEASLSNNEMTTTVTLTKREPLVETEGWTNGEDLTLEKNQYFIHDYEEYYENGKLCTTIESKEVCVLATHDGVHFPYSVNGKQEELGWKAKLLYWFNDESFIYGILSDFVNVKIDDVRIYVTGAPGTLIEIEK